MPSPQYVAPPAPTATPAAAPPLAAAVVLGAGSGSRVGAEVNKVLLPLRGVPLLAWSVRTALATPGVGPVVVVCRAGERAEVAHLLGEHLAEDLEDRAPGHEVLLVDGGSTRQASEQAALDVLAPRIADGAVDVVAIHDGARPLADVELWQRAVAVAREHGGAVPAHDLPGLLPRAGGALPIAGTDRLVGVQTPQAFRAAPLVASYAAARAEGFDGTDTAATYARYAEAAGHEAAGTIRAVPSGPRNLKVTFADDLALAAELLD
ncbi:IspD/TarI family cytidylyltransferase [Nocardioides faecalis]|uniref:IspD/TarI family cytidylyltransferase n=1 Tax=Nocardioides faecalis TaxID=2803858 RepID=UPI0020C0B600|nr:2-C-methyl-D-erythritol 4-phosphate cytidylyltransferase [Nocardioides faecalis]